MTGFSPDLPPVFDAAFQERFEELLLWRRDVRRFRKEPLPEGLIGHLLSLADHAPSVGNSQPWRIVSVESDAARGRVLDNFKVENARALDSYADEQAEIYAKLKLAGLQEAPVHLAVFCEVEPEQGHGLGRATMPETLVYSVVGMIQTLWLAARAHGIGLGWVSILDPSRVCEDLKVPANWIFVGYLCLGFPEEEHLDPELSRAGWQDRTTLAERLFQR